MRVFPTDDSNPGDLGLRVDSPEDREVAAKAFPGMGMEKHAYLFDNGFPSHTSLLYDVIKHESDSDEITGVWTGYIGWDEYEKAIDVSIRANWKYSDDGSYWTLRVEFHPAFAARGDSGLDLFGRYEYEITQKRKASASPSARHAVVSALRHLFDDLSEDDK